MHTIRLREPWQREWTGVENSARDTRPARYHRYFHRPSGLLDQQPVTLILSPRWLVTNTAQAPHDILQTDAPASPQPQIIVHALLLNSQLLPFEVQRENRAQSTHYRVGLDSWLAPYNQLEIMCELPTASPSGNRDFQSTELPPPLAEWAEVRLEIVD